METEILFQRISRSDREAFNLLVESYYESLNAFAFHMLKNRQAAEDVVQDVFATLWLSRRKIDLDAPLKNYLYVATRNHTFNHIRSSRRLRQRLDRTPHQEEHTNMFIVEEEANRLLLAAIDRLPPRAAEVIRLSLDEVPQQQIAEQMGITVSTVKALKSAAIKRLKEILGVLAFILVQTNLLD